MFFATAISKKLVSLLRPWLQQEPELELKLGFLRSNGIAKNLRFDTSVLNQLIDDSPGLSFKDVRVDHLSFQLSYCSFPALTIGVRGVHVTLSGGELKEERHLTPRDTYSEDMRKILALIDPEGTALHDMLERISGTTLSRNSLTTSFLNVILNHCRLEIHDIHMQVQFSMSTDSFGCLFEMKELSMESQYLKHGCLLKGLVGALFAPLKESCFVIDGRGFEIRLKREEHINCVLPAVDLFACIKFKDLQPVDISLRVPQVSFSLSPLDLPIILAFDVLLSQGSKRVRSGRQLWRIAASRIGFLISVPRLSLQRLISVVGLWIRHVNTYEYLLSQVGYSADCLVKRSAVTISEDKMFSNSVKHNWNVISEIEKELPAEAIAQARRIARYRAALNVQHAGDVYIEPLINNRFKFICKIISLLNFIWKLIFSIFHLLLHFLCLRNPFSEHQKVDVNLGIASDGSCPRCCFSLNLGKVSVIVSPVNVVCPPVSEKLESDIGISYSELLSFCISIDMLLLIYKEEICEHSVSFSCGQLKVTSSSAMEDLVGESSSRNSFGSLKGHQKEKINDSKTILWGEPAQMFLLMENSTTNHAESASVSFLENLLEEMSLSWQRTSLKFEGSEIQFLENPCILLGIKSFLISSGLRDLDPGLWSCCLTVGKLNFSLGYSSILSVALLCKQIQHALCWAKDNGKSRVISHSPETIEDLPETNLSSRYKFYAREMKTAIIGMLPEKRVELGVLIAGPHIQMSLRKEGFNGSNEDMNHVVDQDDFELAFDVHNIELALWPMPNSEFASSIGHLGLNDVEPQSLSWKEPRIIDTPKSDDENYKSQSRTSLSFYLKINGLNAYWEASDKNQESKIFALKPITVQSSSFRESLHSFSTTFVAFSAALHGVATGFTFLLSMDELYVFLQVVVSLFSSISLAFTTVNSMDCVHCQEFMRQEVIFASPENEEKLAAIATGASLISKRILFVVNGTFQLNSVDIILQDSRKSDKMEGYLKTINGLSAKNLDEVPEDGIWISVHQTCFVISCEEGKLEVHTDLSRIQSVVFRSQSPIETSIDQSELRNLLQQSLDCLYEISLSNLAFTFSLASLENVPSSGSVTNALDGFTSGDISPSTIATETSNLHSLGLNQALGFASINLEPASSHWLLINISVTEIFLVRSTVKNVLAGAHQMNKLLSSLSVGGEFQTISWAVQGGFVFLETTAVVKIFHCFASYACCITDLLSVMSSSLKHIEKTEHSPNMARLDDLSIEEHVQETLSTSQQVRWALFEAFTMGISQISIVLVAEDESGKFRELVLEADIRLDLELVNMRKKFMLDFSSLSILSQILCGSVKNEIQIPHFASGISNDLLSHSLPGDPTIAFQRKDGTHPVPDGASSSSDPVSKKEALMHNSVSEGFQLSCQRYILKRLRAFILVQKSMPETENVPLRLYPVWVGNGSVSGFDMIISLSEIQMILSAVASFSEISTKETIDNLKQEHQSSSQGFDHSLEGTVPNGAIVAIQDIHQHMYFTVEGAENKYSLVGALHYSLVGERALFRVKYHKHRRWNLPVSWFSLISLHAKSDSGEPLRLNCRPGSGFVDISSTNDSEWALWRTVSYKPESYEGDADWEPYSQLTKNTFYLINKKNDCAVAFVDGIPEFVRKPGNPFKLKVFHDSSLACDVAVLDNHSTETSGSNLQHNPCVDKERTFMQTEDVPCIDVTIDEVSLTIVHELSDTDDKVPLLRGCISNMQLIVQILSSKTRVMSTLSVMLYYFEAQRHLWRELVHPVEICIFYRSSFQIEGSEIVSQSVPMHFYFRCKEVEISLTEVSLDILLFVIGKLNLAGPFSVKTSMILAHCCKVENQSGLNLLFRYQDDQGLSIARKQSASIFLRHLASADQSPENASFASIQLSWFGSFSTSPIHLSLSKTQVLAWRTRIVSLQDSKTYPGPFIVVDISRKSEDGLSVVVSPLIRIHNETTFSMALRFQRPQQVETEFASVLLKTGDTIDDSMAAFDSINVSGGLKKALLSLSVGNFLFSFRPEITDDLGSSKRSLSVSWSDDFKGGKAVRLTGIFDKLNYKVRKAFSVEHVKCSFSTAHCSLKAEGAHIGNMHFLIQSIGRNVPVMLPDKSGDPSENRNSPVALQEQKEIFLLPTVRVSNLLQSEIHVLLTETGADQYTSIGSDNIGNQATILCGSTVDLYANPTIIYFTVTITAFRSSCKPVNSTDWVKKLNKQKNDVYHLDIDLNFGGGKYFACLRLSRGLRGVLEAAIFTSYVLKNDTDFSLFLSAPNQKSLSRDEAQKFGSSIPPEIGLFLPPKSTGSWFLKSNKVRFKLLEGKASESLLDLDALSGLTEISFETEQVSGFKHVTKLGVSLGPSLSKVAVPSQIVSLVPRYVVVNESEEVIIVRQCHLEDDMEHMIHINSGQKTPLQLHMGSSKKREYSLFDNFIRKHRNANDDSLIIVQFQLKDTGLGWSGPVCIASLGRFFLKFKQSLDVSILHSNHLTPQDKTLREFAIVHIVEEGSTLVLHFQKPPKINLPYRIENCLHEVSITYYQKDSEEPETIGSGSSVDYVWDDLTLPHKLVVKIDDIHELREINLDKVRAWKPFFKSWQHRRFPFHLPLDNRPSDQRRTNFGGLNGIEMIKVGYEVYADGTTRVLRICEFPDNHKGDKEFQSCAKIQLRVPCFAVHLLEHGKQDVDASEPSDYTTVIVVKLEHINMDSMFTNQHKFNQIRVQALNVEQKWVGAPFAALLRRHQSEYCEINDSILRVVFVLISTNSNVTQVKNSSIILQPVDLNLDEETLMRIVPFWRTSLSDSKSQSHQFYFDRFEIHPIKIIASFLPGDSYSSYSSAQETVRSLLHSVIKIPAIKNMVVELNGVLITHALITMRELFIKCAQHYSWYAMRAIYIAKGSPLLPPSFASIFDDSASSSLDVFFDPSSGLINLPGLTLGTFKLISKCIDGKGFSGTKRYFGDLGKTLRTAGSNVLFAVVTEISDSVLKGAETSGFNGMVSGFHQGILRLAMEPSLLGTAFVEGGPDRKIKLDRSPGVDELYIEGYLQAMLDTVYKQEYLRVRVIDNQVFLKNLPPNSSLIEEIMDRVKGFLISKALLKGDSSTTSRPLRHLRGESEWKIGPTVLTLCEHLFVSFAIRMLRKQAGKLIGSITWKEKSDDGNQKAIVPISQSDGENQKAIVPASHSAEGLKVKFMWRWGIGKFVLSGIVAYIDGRLCRSIPNPLARRIVSGFLLSFLETDDH